MFDPNFFLKMSDTKFFFLIFLFLIFVIIVLWRLWVKSKRWWKTLKSWWKTLKSWWKTLKSWWKRSDFVVFKKVNDDNFYSWTQQYIWWRLLWLFILWLFFVISFTLLALPAITHVFTYIDWELAFYMKDSWLLCHYDFVVNKGFLVDSTFIKYILDIISPRGYPVTESIALLLMFVEILAIIYLCAFIIIFRKYKQSWKWKFFKLFFYIWVLFTIWVLYFHPIMVDFYQGNFEDHYFWDASSGIILCKYFQDEIYLMEYLKEFVMNSVMVNERGDVYTGGFYLKIIFMDPNFFWSILTSTPEFKADFAAAATLRAKEIVCIEHYMSFQNQFCALYFLQFGNCPDFTIFQLPADYTICTTTYWELHHWLAFLFTFNRGFKYFITFFDVYICPYLFIVPNAGQSLFIPFWLWYNYKFLRSLVLAVMYRDIPMFFFLYSEPVVKYYNFRTIYYEEAMHQGQQAAKALLFQDMSLFHFFFYKVSEKYTEFLLYLGGSDLVTYILTWWPF